ncbi:HAD family hydrolase [Candidatus Woesearchaeota archaeon]|nr:HAD family hydrolase [Candidatus Woesearchaeota archaeon]
MQIQYLILDADGTLFDSMPAYARIFSSSLARPPYHIPLEESSRFYLSTAGAPLVEQYGEILRQHHKPTEACSTLVQEFFQEVENADIPAFQDVLEMLPRLSRYTRCLVTGTATAITQRRLERTGLSAHIEYVYGFDSQCKTKEEAFVRMREIFGRDFTRNAAYVGDGITDMQLAVREGAIPIGRIGVFSERALRSGGAQHVIPDFFALEKLLQKFSSSADSGR